MVMTWSGSVVRGKYPAKADSAETWKRRSEAQIAAAARRRAAGKQRVVTGRFARTST